MIENPTLSKVGCRVYDAPSCGLSRNRDPARCVRGSVFRQPPGRKKGSMLSVETALPEVEELHKLVEQGQEKGVLTHDEIVKSVEDVNLTKKQLEDFTTFLIDHSIDLVEGEQHKALPHEQPIVTPDEVARAPQPAVHVEPD